MDQPHVIIFDVEGTLVDCVPQTIACWQQTLAEHGFHFSLRRLHAYSGMDSTLMLRTLLRRRSRALVKTLQDEQGERYREKYLPYVRPFPGARALCAGLVRDGHRLGLATTSQPDELRAYLRMLHITDFISATVCGKDVDREKPAPNMIKLAAHRLMASRLDRLWVVGDTPYDARAARAFGAKAVGTLGGGYSERQLRRAGCLRVAGDLADLLQKLRALLK
jgi:phosphoglycolate phosphatase-like HAD superfamily hydrolase